MVLPFAMHLLSSLLVTRQGLFPIPLNLGWSLTSFGQYNMVDVMLPSLVSDQPWSFCLPPLGITLRSPGEGVRPRLQKDEKLHEMEMNYHS